MAKGWKIGFQRLDRKWIARPDSSKRHLPLHLPLPYSTPGVARYTTGLTCPPPRSIKKNSKHLWRDMVNEMYFETLQKFNMLTSAPIPRNAARHALPAENSWKFPISFLRVETVTRNAATVFFSPSPFAPFPLTPGDSDSIPFVAGDDSLPSPGTSITSITQFTKLCERFTFSTIV